MKKIFLTVGTHREQFNRLIKEMDELVKERKVKAKVFGQTGNSTYEPKSFPFSRFLDDSSYQKKVKESDLVIAHGGAGAIITALKEKKPLIVVPRLKRFKEHTNDHQLDLMKALQRKGKIIGCSEVNKLEEAIKKAEDFKPKKTQGTKIINALGEFFAGKN